MKDEPDAGRGLLSYLARAYAYKQLGDYAIGPDAAVSPFQAADAIDGAQEFLGRVERMLG